MTTHPAPRLTGTASVLSGSVGVLSRAASVLTDPGTVLKRLAGTGSGGTRVAAVPLGVGAAARVPRVSVVVPCYNYGHYLPECLASILGQPGVDVDVLVIDDCSPDGSGDVAQKLAIEELRVRVIVHETNAGHIRTYNEGLAQVDGDYVVLLSADDVLTPGALARATAVMEQYPEVGLVYGRPVIFFEEVPVARQDVRDWTVWTGPDWITAQARRGMSCIFSPEAVVRTSVQHAVGEYDVDLPHTGDLDMWLRIAAVAGVGHVNGPDQAFRREHPASMMHTTYAAALDDLRGRASAYHAFFAGAGAHLGREQGDIARRRLAEQALDLACVGLRARSTDSGSAAEIAAYAAFAFDVWPAADRLWQYREYTLLRRGPEARSAVAGRVSESVCVARRNLEGRLRWQRWDWSGV